MFSKFVHKLPAPQTWSLTSRITLFFSVALSIIVVGISAMMYADLDQKIYEKEAAELVDNLQIQQEVLEGLEQKNASSRWKHEWGEYQEEHQRFAWQLLDAQGGVRAQSANAARLASARTVHRDGLRFGRIKVGQQQGKREFLVTTLAITKTAISPGQLRGFLDVTQDELVIHRYRARLVAVVLGAVLLSAGTGWLLARRGLAPVRAISEAIGDVNVERLHARIANEVWPSDLRLLAQAFDDLLARLEQSFVQLSRFSSDLAHEFRSPINNLVAAASVTLGRERDAEEYQTTLAIVVDEGNRLSRMVSSMLFLARAENATQALRLETVSTAAEFRKLVEFYELMAEENGVTLQSRGDLALSADPMLLSRALSNLMANALRYTPRGGVIRLSARKWKHALAITVMDNGTGIAAEHLPYLFDRFYRADAARSSAESTGLGLAVVRSIVELHGGMVTVRSRLGHGAAFVLRFPRQLTSVHLASLQTRGNAHGAA